MRIKIDDMLFVIFFSALLFVLGISVFFFSRPITAENNKTVKAATADEVELPSDYKLFGEGNFISDSE